jgi:hypothetical protein
VARKDPVSHLARFETAPPRLVDEIRALGPAAVPALRALLDAPGALIPDSPARRGAANAAPLYGELGGAEAVPRLLEIVLHAPLGSDLAAGAVVGLSLVSPGSATVEAILALPEPPPEREESLLWALGAAHHPDPRIPPRLRAHLQRDPGTAALIAAGYGDASLLPDLRAAFDAFPFGVEVTPAQSRDAHSLLRAIEHLGRSAPEDQARWLRLRDVLRVSREVMRRELEDLTGR